jgi:tetratricopeptide (TPR) repeat protein
VLALVHGRSGVGKTALLDAFLRARARLPGAVVLRGRCYERESVPYKAIDGLVDALTRHLRTWPAEQLAAALPEDFAALTRVFPVLARSLAPEILRDLHKRLADVLEREPEPDSERLAFHCHGAGQYPRAGQHAVVAAERAFAALAFDRAATLFGQALEWSPLAPAQARALMVRRAEALVYASRCAEAGTRYLEVANVAAPAVALELRRKAAEQYLISGHLDDGMRVLHPLLRELGLRYPDGDKSAVLQLLLGQARIRLRGLDFRPRIVSDPPAATLQLDTCWSIAKGLGFIDPLRAAIFAAENLRRSLEHGDPLRVARALAHHALLDVNQGQPHQASRGAAQIARAHELALKTGDPQTIGTTTIMRGVADLNAGRWRSALVEVEAGVAILAERCVGVTWERSIARAMAMHALTMLGQFADLGPRASAWLREANDLGDRFASVVAGLYVGHARLAAGDLAGAREAVSRARAAWPREGFHFQHWLALSIEVACDLYSGEGRAAWQRMQTIWPAIERSNLLRMQIPRIDTLMLRAGAAIAAAQNAPDRRKLLWAAGRDARALARESLEHAGAFASVIRAGIAVLTGDPAEALRQFDRAEAVFEANDMPLHAASVRWRRALLRHESSDRAADELRARGVADPIAFVATLAPCAVAAVPSGDGRLS